MSNDESVYPVNPYATDLQRMNIAVKKAHMKWDCEQKILMGRHVLVLGTTGSGKTYFAAYYAFKYYPRFIFVNTQLEEVVTKVTQVTCNTPDEIFDALEDGYKRIEFVPALNRDEAKEQLSNIRMRLFEIGHKMGLPEGEFWITILIDEIQDFAEKQRESDVNNYFRRGRHNRVRVWGLTLKPQDISGTVLSQTEYQIIFISGNFQQQYFRGHQIPYDSWLLWLEKDFHYVLLNQKGEACFCAPIDTKEIGG